MSVRPEALPTSPSLASREGELVSIHVCVDPRLLERLLEALARLSFPVNPQIYHQAGVAYVYPDGRGEIQHATIVEFPAFSSQVPEVRSVLKVSGLPPEAMHERRMLDDIHSDHYSTSAPPGAAYCRVNYYRYFPGP